MGARAALSKRHRNVTPGARAPSNRKETSLMARRRVADEADATEKKYEQEEREAIQDETLNKREEAPVRRRAVAESTSKEVEKSDIDFRPPNDSPRSPEAGDKPFVVNNTAVLSGNEVTVVWGKELFSPASFHTFEVGPFTATTRVIPGETFSVAAERAMEDLRRFAEKERERKKASYLRMVETTSKRG